MSQTSNAGASLLMAVGTALEHLRLHPRAVPTPSCQQRLTHPRRRWGWPPPSPGPAACPRLRPAMFTRRRQRGSVHAPGSVRLATADVGCLWGIRTEVIGSTGVFAGHGVAAYGL